MASDPPVRAVTQQFYRTWSHQCERGTKLDGSIDGEPRLEHGVLGAEREFPVCHRTGVWKSNAETA